jgi:DNA-binding PadR family transcriptional regulator
MGFVSASESDGKKVYTVTAAGEGFLKEQRETLEKTRGQMRGWQRPRDHEDFRETILELRTIGGLLARRAHDLGPEKWTRLKEVMSRARKEFEEILEKG